MEGQCIEDDCIVETVCKKLIFFNRQYNKQLTQFALPIPIDIWCGSRSKKNVLICHR